MQQSNQDKSETNESVDSFFESTTTTDYREVLFSKTDNVLETLFSNTDDRHREGILIVYTLPPVVLGPIFLQKLGVARPG